MKNVITVFASVLLLSGCVTTTWTPYYKDLQPKYEAVYKIKAPLVVAVQDQRPYVLSGDKSELFYGLTRSLYGIPYSINGQVTVSNDILEYINLLITTEHTDSRIQKISIDIKANGLEQATHNPNHWPVLFIQVNEWKTDSPAIGTGILVYDLEAVVLTKDGEVIVRKNIKGKEKMVNPDPDSESQKVTGRWHQKVKGDALGKILLDSEVVTALNSFGEVNTIKSSENNLVVEGTPPVKDNMSEEGSKSNCTTEQILMMKNSNLSNTQIMAACE